MTDFDLLIIGTGSGNSIVDERFAHQRVAIAEEWHFGGTCLNVGCIPTKMFVRPADVAADVADSARLDIDGHYDGVDWTSLQQRIFGRVDAIEADGRDYRTHRQSNVTVFAERVSFTGPHSFVTASGEQFTAQRVVIATGSRPVVPVVNGLDPSRVDEPDYPVHTSDSIMRVPNLPESLIIVGGGYIAMEFAHTFAALGTRVTVVVRGDSLLSHLDSDVSRAFTTVFATEHDVRFGLQAASLETSPAGVRMHFSPSGRVDGAQPQTLEAQLLLVAAGRAPNTRGLDIQAAGIEVDGQHRIMVDEYLRVRTKDGVLPGAFALGDVSSPFQLKHVANHEARVVQHNLLAEIDAAQDADPVSHFEKVDHRAVPAAVFTRPQVATLGETEDQLRARGADYVAHTQPYSSTAYGWALNDESSFAKVLADRGTQEVLGAHIMGSEASMIIQPLIQAMAFHQPAHEVARGQYWIHPALTEVIENALLGLNFDSAED